MNQLVEDIFDENIRIDHVLSTLTAVHYESLPDTWEESLEDPTPELTAILAEQFGITKEKIDKWYANGECLPEMIAEAITRSRKHGFIVIYSIPVYSDVDFKADGSFDGGTHYGFGCTQQHYFFASELCSPAFEKLVESARQHKEVMIEEFRVKKGVKCVEKS